MMANEVDIEWDQDFFDNLLKSPEVAALTKRAAEQAAIAARATAPYDTGALQGSIHVEEHETAYRKIYRVRADDEKAMLIESKTGNLRKALGKAKL